MTNSKLSILLLLILSILLASCSGIEKDTGRKLSAEDFSFVNQTTTRTTVFKKLRKLKVDVDYTEKDYQDIFVLTPDNTVIIWYTPNNTVDLMAEFDRHYRDKWKVLFSSDPTRLANKPALETFESLKTGMDTLEFLPIVGFDYSFVYNKNGILGYDAYKYTLVDNSNVYIYLLHNFNAIQSIVLEKDGERTILVE